MHNIIETDRLLITPLNYEQLIKYVQGDVFDDHYRSMHFPAQRIADTENIVLPRVANKNFNPLFVTLWAIVLKSEGVAIGDLFFKGEPDEKREVEIGYECYDGFAGKGYMSEAVAGVIDWAVNQKNIRSIIAEVEQENVASLRVLEKNGFLAYKKINAAMMLRKIWPQISTD